MSGNIYASIQLYSPIIAGLFSNKCNRTELEYMQLWREGIEHRSRASIVYLISNWGWKHKIRIFVACWMCRKLRAFGGDQTDPKFVWGTKFNFKDWGVGHQTKCFKALSHLFWFQLNLFWSFGIFRTSKSPHLTTGKNLQENVLLIAGAITKFPMSNASAQTGYKEPNLIVYS